MMHMIPLFTSVKSRHMWMKKSNCQMNIHVPDRLPNHIKAACSITTDSLTASSSQKPASALIIKL